jgi:hypothetical protein
MVYASGRTFDWPQGRFAFSLGLPTPFLCHQDKAPPSFAVRQHQLILKSMQNTTPPVQAHVGTGIYNIGSL